MGGRNFCKLRTPPPNVLAVRIEFLTLGDRIKYAEVRRGIRAATHCPLPPECVLRQVGIHEGVPEPTGALLPGNQQIFCQKGSYNHPDAIMHPAGAPQLAHPGVHNGISRATLLPGTEKFGVLAPRKPLEIGSQRLGGRVRKVKKQVVSEFPPTNLREELQSAPVGFWNAFCLRLPTDSVPDLTGGNFTEVKMRRKTRTAGASRTVAVFIIAR